MKIAAVLAVLVLQLTLSSSAWPAETEKRPSSVEVSASGASGGSFFGTDFGAKLGLDRMWQLFAAVDSSRSGSDLLSRQIRLGADSQLRSVGLHAALIRKTEPNDLSANGLNLGGEYEISTLWNAEHASMIFFDVEAYRYKLGSNLTSLALKKDVFLEVSGTIGISQEIARNVSLLGTASLHSYGEDAGGLSRAISGRRAMFPNTAGLIEGFPSDSFSAAVHWQALTPLLLSVEVSSSGQALNDTRAQGTGLSASYDATEHWAFTADSASSSSAGSATLYQFGAGFVYQW